MKKELSDRQFSHKEVIDLLKEPTTKAERRELTKCLLRMRIGRLKHKEVAFRKCGKCKRRLSIDQFAPNSNYCKECKRRYNRKYYEQNKQHHYELVKEWRKTHAQNRAMSRLVKEVGDYIINQVKSDPEPDEKPSLNW